MISLEENLNYPLIIEVPDDYWVSSHDVEYVESN
jgi:hypothetical protein|tara:strand:+ start:182 stop:283 length:102 start_codon:yes stop_codon:yes gene_type:complete